jgi:hypothetical protein
MIPLEGTCDGVLDDYNFKQAVWKQNLGMHIYYNELISNDSNIFQKRRNPGKKICGCDISHYFFLSLFEVWPLVKTGLQTDSAC